MPKVYNRHHKDAPTDAVYIGRGTPWGNPYSHLAGVATFQVDSKEEALVAFEEWVYNRPVLLQKIKKELKGKDLVCSCAPKACHGDLLLVIANEEN